LVLFGETKKGFDMVLYRAWQEYLLNFKVALAFVLLGVFVFFFIFFSNAFISSGSVFFEYGLLKSGFFTSLFEIIALLAYLLFFSVFLSVMIFSVRHDLNETKMQHYLMEKLPKFVFTNFAFFAMLSILAVALSALLVIAGLPNYVVAILLFVASTLFMFTPQAIVIDEERITNALLNALHFFFSNKRLALFVLIIASILLAIIPLIEIFFDSFSFSGRFVSILIVLLFVLPFIEVLKTIAYLTKFDLIKTQI
jgi:hypothetical protein